MSVIVDDDFFCSQSDMTLFKEGRVWREMRSWINERRMSLVDSIDTAHGDLEVRLIQREMKVLRDMLELPDLIIATLDVRDANAEKDEENVNVDDEQRSAPDATLGGYPH